MIAGSSPRSASEYTMIAGSSPRSASEYTMIAGSSPQSASEYTMIAGALGEPRKGLALTRTRTHDCRCAR
jgi:hypothetical protein